MISNKPGIIPIFVPHLGCPHDCVFCNQKTITGQQEAYGTEMVIREIEAHLETMTGRRHPIEIAFFGGSFTGIPVQKQIEFLDIARRYLYDGRIHGIRLSTRPDYIDEKVLERLLAYGVTTVELGVQSLNEEVLRLSERGHDIQQVRDAVRQIRKTDLKLGLQMMLGLPGDTLEKSMETADAIIAMKPDFVRIYPTVVIRGTVLENMYDTGTYNALSVEDAVEWLSEIMPRFAAAHIPVIRVGLQPTEELIKGDTRRAGAYHPSLRQLAESRIILKRIETKLVDVFKCGKGHRVSLSACERDWTVVRGQKRSNFNALEKRYPTLEWTYNISETASCGYVNLSIETEHETIDVNLKID